MQRAYAEKSKEKRKENAAGHMWNGQQFHIRRFSSLLFSSALFFSFILFTLYLIFLAQSFACNVHVRGGKYLF